MFEFLLDFFKKDLKNTTCLIYCIIINKDIRLPNWFINNLSKKKLFIEKVPKVISYHKKEVHNMIKLKNYFTELFDELSCLNDINSYVLFDNKNTDLILVENLSKEIDIKKSKKKNKHKAKLEDKCCNLFGWINF